MQTVAIMYLNVRFKADYGYVVGLMESSAAATVDEFLVDGEFLPITYWCGPDAENMATNSARRLGKLKNLPVIDLTTIECVHAEEY